VTGIFSRWQQAYADHRIATFPVDESKKPRIKGWQKVGLKGSAELADKFTDADAIGYVTGRRSNVTVLDVDTTDAKIAEDAIRRHGAPAIVIRTASGKSHLLYRYNGEGRRIRPWPELPIDVLGDNGYALAAPSKLATGSYEIIHGHFSDLDRLKPMVGADARQDDKALQSPESRLRGMREHDGRNNALFNAIGPIARTIHQSHGTFDDLLDAARKLNAQCAEPMGDTEVNRTTTSVWGMTLEGRNFIGAPEILCLREEHLEIEDTSAFKLLAFLRLHQGPHATFMCTNSLAPKFGWDRERIARARRALIELGHLVPVRQAGRGHPALFRWGKY